MSIEINRTRRSFLATAAMTIAATQLSMVGCAQSNGEQSADAPPTSPGSNATFGPIKQIDAGLLNIGYAEAGPADGPPVILLHGWPYDIYSFVDVTPILAAKG